MTESCGCGHSLIEHVVDYEGEDLLAGCTAETWDGELYVCGCMKYIPAHLALEQQRMVGDYL